MNIKHIFACALLLFPVTTSLGASFSDVPESSPSYAAVESLKNLLIINGYPDGTFQPNKPVTRAESLKMILVGAHIEVGEESKKSVFSDISKDAWYTPYIEKANSLQIVKGYGNTGTFMPDNQVTKAEFLKILFHAFEKDLSKHEGVSKSVSADTSVGQWYLPYLSYAKTMGIITPDFDNNLSPNKKLTRSECAEIIYKLLVIERGGEVQKLLKISESHLVTLLIDLSQNDIDAAIQNAEAAVQYSQKAIDASPNEGIVRAAHKIAKGFQQLCFGYKAGTEEKYDEVRSYVQSAKEFAGEAFNEHNGTQVLGKKIKEQGDILLQQIPVP